MNSYDAYMEEDWNVILNEENREEIVFKNNELLTLNKTIKDNNL